MVYIFLFLLIVCIDQFTKYLAYNRLRLGGSKIIIENFLKFTYVENTGAAFGIFSQKTGILSIVTILVCIILGFYFIKNYSSLNTIVKISFTMILAGAIGNLIDRIFRGFVVDFISFRLFSFYDFPVFNVADIFVVLGAFLMFIFALFMDEGNKIDG